MAIIKKSVQLAGREISFETGRFALQATSSVLARYGDSVVLAAVTIGKEDLKKDYFPLSVEYQERLYAGGKIKGSRWVKRERNTDEETLSARLIDRSIRPHFPKDFKNEVQVIVMVLSTDVDNDTDVLGINAASAALAISPIPWNGPVMGMRVGITDGQLVSNPKNGNQPNADLDLVVSGTDSLVTMLEAGANQISEDQMIQALELAMKDGQVVINLIKDLVKDAGQEKITVKKKSADSEFVSTIEKAAQLLVNEYLSTASKKEGNSLEAIISTVSEGVDDKQKLAIPAIVEDLVYRTLRTGILENEVRADGRKLDEIRPLYIEAGVLPRVHGSAIFQRGQTQALTVATLGAPSLSQIFESAEGEEVKRYMHHYNFPPFSTGETGRVGAPKRREIGHGALAERGLSRVIPSEADFPYAIRVVSEILGSNGSSSMASTCGSTIALMDAGVPLKAPVAGISIGLITSDDNYKLITDIIGLEDHYGDMDFKVAGTENGITAIQLDTKIPGLTFEICKETFTKAKTARMQILKSILAVISKPRNELSKYAPKISRVQIPVDKIGELIGPGGKNIKKLMSENDVIIDVNDDGSVFVSGTDTVGTNKVISYLQAMSKVVKAGEIYDGVVANLAAFGAFVNILPGKDGLVHVSRMAKDYVADPSTVVSPGQTIKVWVTEVTTEGKIGLSMLFDENGAPFEKPEQPRSAERPTSRFNAPRRRF